MKRANIPAPSGGFILLSAGHEQSKYSSSPSRFHTPVWVESMKQIFQPARRPHTPEWRKSTEQMLYLYQKATHLSEGYEQLFQQASYS